MLYVVGLAIIGFVILSQQPVPQPQQRHRPVRVQVRHRPVRVRQPVQQRLPVRQQLAKI